MPYLQWYKGCEASGIVGFKDTTNGERTSIILPFTRQEDRFVNRKNQAALNALNQFSGWRRRLQKQQHFNRLLYKALKGTMWNGDQGLVYIRSSSPGCPPLLRMASSRLQVAAPSPTTASRLPVHISFSHQEQWQSGLFYSNSNVNFQWSGRSVSVNPNMLKPCPPDLSPDQSPSPNTSNHKPWDILDFSGTWFYFNPTLQDP
jgi:hypothetical protein